MEYTPIHQKDLTQMDCDLADDELNRIVDLKESLVIWFDGISQYFKNSGMLSPYAISQWEAIHQEKFDEQFHDEWHRLTKISGSIEWTSEIPSCEVLRANMAKQKMLARRPVFTNPATRRDV